MNLVEYLFGQKKAEKHENFDMSNLFSNKQKTHHRETSLFFYGKMEFIKESSITDYLSDSLLKRFPRDKDKFIWYKITPPKSISIEKTFADLIGSLIYFDRNILHNLIGGQRIKQKHWILFYYMSQFLHFLYEDEMKSNNLINHTQRYILFPSKEGNREHCLILRTNFYWMELYRLYSYIYLLKNFNNPCFMHPIIVRLYEFAHVPLNYNYNIQNNGILTYNKELYFYLTTFKKWFVIYWIGSTLLDISSSISKAAKNNDDSGLILDNRFNVPVTNHFMHMIKPYAEWVEDRKSVFTLGDEEHLEENNFWENWKKYDEFFHHSLDYLFPTTHAFIEAFSSHNFHSINQLTFNITNPKEINETSPISTLTSCLFLESKHVMKSTVFDYFYRNFADDVKKITTNMITSKFLKTNLSKEEEVEAWKLYKERQEEEKKQTNNARLLRDKYPDFWESLQLIKKYNDSTTLKYKNYLFIDLLSGEEEEKVEFEKNLKQHNFKNVHYPQIDSQQYSLSSSNPDLSQMESQSLSEYDMTSDTDNHETSADSILLMLRMNNWRQREKSTMTSTRLLMNILSPPKFDETTEFAKEEIYNLTNSTLCLSKIVNYRSHKYSSACVKKSSKEKEKEEEEDEKNSEIEQNDDDEDEDQNKKRLSKKRKKSSTSFKDEDDNLTKRQKTDKSVKTYKVGKKTDAERLHEIYDKAMVEWSEKAMNCETYTDEEEQILPVFYKKLIIPMTLYPMPSKMKHSISVKQIYKLTATLEAIVHLPKEDKKDYSQIESMLYYIDEMSSHVRSSLLNPLEVLINVDKHSETITSKRRRIPKSSTNQKQQITQWSFVDQNLLEKQAIWDLDSVMSMKTSMNHQKAKELWNIYSKCLEF